MDDSEWHRLLDEFRDVGSLVRAVAACDQLQANATVDDVPRVVALLSDRRHFVRVTVAQVLSTLGQVDALPQLLRAYQQGFYDDVDNSEFTTALVELISANYARSTTLLASLSRDPDAGVRESAAWLLRFCEERDA